MLIVFFKIIIYGIYLYFRNLYTDLLYHEYIPLSHELLYLSENYLLKEICVVVDKNVFHDFLKKILNTKENLI